MGDHFPPQVVYTIHALAEDGLRSHPFKTGLRIMYLCRKCGADFIDPLGGRCPVCGARVKRSWKLKVTRPASEPPSAAPSKPAARTAASTPTADSTSRPYRSPTGGEQPLQPVDRFPDSGVYGPPKDYGVSAASARGTTRRGRGALILVLIIVALLGVVALVIFLLASDYFVKGVVEEITEGFTETVETLEPLWRDRAAEMREAGYAPVAGLPADLWPVADHTIWFVADDEVIYYEAVRDPEVGTLPLPNGVISIGDIHPTPDGSGIVAVLRTTDGLGVHLLTPAGEAELLLDGEALYDRLSREHAGEPGYIPDLILARSTGDLLRQPRLDEAMETLYVAAGPPGEYEIWITDLDNGETRPFESYNTNLIPCVVFGDVLFYQHHSEGPGDPALVYAEDRTTGEHEFIMTPGNTGGIISFDSDAEGFLVYLAEDYEDTPVVGYQLPGEVVRGDLYLPGNRPKSAAVGPGGVIVTTGAYEGEDHFFFFNIENLNDPDMPYGRNWSGIVEIRSACLGPPLAAY